MMINEEEKRQHRCCFTGHRPEKLHISEEKVKELLKAEIEQAVFDGFNVFITGMARGVDIWAAMIVLNMRKTDKEVKLICASPYPNFEKQWTSSWQLDYNYIMSNADLVRFISPFYIKSCFQIRNQWMVNHSKRVIAVFTGEKSGTKNTVDYALRHGIEVRNVLDTRFPYPNCKTNL